MTQSELLIRHRLFELGKHIRDMVLDEDEQARIGAELVALSGMCENCNGSGQDGDPPDAAGVGGGFFRCAKCDGSGFFPPKRPGVPECDAISTTKGD